MVAGVRYCTIIATVCILLPGCAGTPRTATEPHSAGSRMPAMTHPGTDPALDHFIARLPYQLADTATQARAMTHVAIGRAKARTGGRQCGNPWLITGPASESSGPHLAPRSGAPAWYYRISHRPGLAGCDSASREDLYNSLEEALPAWITLRRAAHTAPDNTGMSLIRALH